MTTRIRESRLNKKGETRILAVLFQGKKTKELSTGVSVKPKHWEKSRQKISVKDKSYQVKNSKLKKFLSDLETVIDEQQILNKSVTLDQIVQSFKGESSSDPLLVDYLRKYIDSNPNKLKSGTLMYYSTCLERIKDFSPKVKLSGIDEKYLGSFESHLKTKHSNKQNTVFNRLKVLRKILLVARREGLINSNPFEFYKIKTEETTRDYLSIDELKKLISLTNLPPSYELVRDMYVFSAFSGGIRFGDISTLSKFNLSIKENEYRLELKTSKTNKLISFRLPSQSIELIRKYDGQGPGDYLFPILPKEVDENNSRKLISAKNAYFNKVLKLLAKKASIDKHITFHTARHTWATISLSEGIQTEIVGDILGHKDLKTTQIYTNILDERKVEAMDKWDNLMKEKT